ncbi:hypothetical protein [Microbacterium radiodurans]|uniref:Uncharacterized protein n=1 Tax=Microbacterium radiodurans TaxID=661398 RepID=A0A5J5IY36_9MICO|nr:hypothetical protein [Microbacterium radiodurans]KAA9089470.1 hypothetical protein F6B42_03035 [Microbacterium radiodurans]
MGTTLLLLVLAMLAAAGVVGTLMLVLRDGYRRVPTDPARALPPTDVTAAAAPAAAPAVSGRVSRGRDGMPRAAVTRIHST